jgi:hypothetical protein
MKKLKRKRIFPSFTGVALEFFFRRNLELLHDDEL